jgi:hypothetical protein
VGHHAILPYTIILLGWYTRQVDFTLAYPQADVERPLYMEVPMGVQVEIGCTITHTKEYVLQLIKNLYGQKQAGRVWYLWLTGRLTKAGFQQSKIDPCVFYYQGKVLLIYVDDTIILGPTLQGIEDILTKLRSQFNIDDEGDMSDYLGVRVTREKDGTIHLTQPHLIESILRDLHLIDKKQTTTRALPALTTRILHPDATGTPFNNRTFHYRSIVGRLNFLEKSTRPDIAYAVHQCARFVENPTELHAEAIKRIGRYILGTATKGLILRPTKDNASFDCWVDASHAGEWRKHGGEAVNDSTTAKSRSGYVLLYAGCPILWASKLQTEIALSSTEAEYIAISSTTREVIPLLRLMEETRQHGLPINVEKGQVHCRIFEDNSGALEMAQTPKMRPRTKHINIKYHHFLSQVTTGLLSLHPVSSENQFADIFTKPLPDTPFLKHRKAIMGW